MPLTRLRTAITGPGRPTLLFFLVLDGLLIAGDVASRLDTPGFEYWRWYSASDRSFAEIFGYLQMLSAAVGLALLARRRSPAPAYAAWAVVLIVIALDDMLLLHERVGLLTSDPDADFYGLRQRDWGELATWGVMGAGFLMLVVVAHRRSRRVIRVDSLAVAIALVALIFFAVFVDMLHSALASHVPARVNAAVTMTEAAGELLAMTVVLALVAGLVREATAGSLSAPDDRAAAVRPSA